MSKGGQCHHMARCYRLGRPRDNQGAGAGPKGRGLVSYSTPPRDQLPAVDRSTQRPLPTRHAAPVHRHGPARCPHAAPAALGWGPGRVRGWRSAPNPGPSCGVLLLCSCCCSSALRSRMRPRHHLWPPSTSSWRGVGWPLKVANAAGCCCWRVTPCAGHLPGGVWALVAAPFGRSPRCGRLKNGGGRERTRGLAWGWVLVHVQAPHRVGWGRQGVGRT